MDPVSTLHLIVLHWLTQDAKYGIGLLILVVFALIDGYLPKLASAYRFLISAMNIHHKVDSVLLATVAMILSMALVHTPLQTLLLQLILDAANGRKMSARHALQVGSSIPMASVLQFLINVRLTMQAVVIVSLAMLDMTSITDHVSSQPLTMPSPPMEDAKPGIGLMPNASPAHQDGSLTQTGCACQSVINVKHLHLTAFATHATAAMI